MESSLKISQKPADKNHPYGHWKFETLASLMTSFLMCIIGLEVIRDAWGHFTYPIQEQPSLITAIIGGISALLMFGVYRYNHSLAIKIHSLGLKAAAKDNLSDALTSLSTSIAILAAKLSFSWLDTGMAIIVGMMILKTAFDIFKESSFQLTDGFEPEEIKAYKPIILAHPEIKTIEEMKARRYGSNIYLDLTVCMDPNLTVWRSHEITEEIELELEEQFGITFVDIHIEPDKKARN